jgi:hypothetical protein
MRDGYGDPAPMVPSSGIAIGVEFQSADAGRAPARAAAVTSTLAASLIHP